MTRLLLLSSTALLLTSCWQPQHVIAPRQNTTTKKANQNPSLKSPTKRRKARKKHYVEYKERTALTQKQLWAAHQKPSLEQIGSPTKRRKTHKEHYVEYKERTASTQKQLKDAHQKQSFVFTQKQLKEFSYAELKAGKDSLLENNDKQNAIIYIERMVAISSDLDELKELRLELADLYFDTSDLEKAESLYTDYLSLYPGSEAIEYVEYKSILCCFYQMLESDRDQSKTRQALASSKTFLAGKYQTYAPDVQLIQKQCVARLFESEANVLTFYLKQGKTSAAEQRLAYIKDQFSVQPSLELAILNLECSIAEKQLELLPKTEPTFNEKMSELGQLHKKQTELTQAEDMYTSIDTQPRQNNYGRQF